MKAKTMTKRAFSLVFSLMTLLLVVAISSTAFAAECQHANLNENNWIIEREATCSVSGSKTQVCPDCLQTIYSMIDIDPDAHIPGQWETQVISTCEREGIDVRRCVQCKLICETRTVPAHNYSVLYGEKATCMKPGYEFMMCMTCYDMKTVNYDIDLTAHEYGEWEITTEATCLNNSGVRTKRCINADGEGHFCDAVITENYTQADNHKNIVWDYENKIAPTCEKEGLLPGECADCKQYLSRELPRHSQVENPFIISTTPSTCHSHGINRVRCVCGYEYDVELEIDEAAHVYSDWIVSKEPSCVAGERFKYCPYHQSTRITESIPKNGEHNLGEWYIEVEPDCSKAGIKARACADCDYIEKVEIPTLHVYTTWIEKSEMNCQEGFQQDGLKLAKCNKCNYERYFTDPAVHNFSDWIVKEHSYCQKGNTGVKERVCRGCGKTETTTYVQEHDFIDWIVIERPVCEDGENTGRTGIYKRWCRSCKFSETKTIPVTHDYEEVEIIKYPECFKNDGTAVTGLKKLRCKFCGAEKEEVIPADHIFAEWTVVKSGSCEPGNIIKGERSATCKLCGYLKTEEFTPEHDFGAWSNSDGFECNDKNNVTLTRQCKNCSYTEETTNNNHPNLKTVKVNRTCTTTGYTMEACPDCGYSKTYDIVSEKGHALEAEWHYIVVPTCTDPGSKYKACADCDYLELETIDHLEHTLIVMEPGIAPTCTSGGATPKTYCANCKEVFESVTLDKLDHEYAEGGEVCIHCYAYKESDGCTCSCHSTSGMEKIIFEIIRKIYQFFGINQQCKCGILHYDEPGFLAKLFGKG